MKLHQLPVGQKARVARIEASAELEAKLREVGFSEGDEVEMLKRAPFGNRTFAVRLNRTIIALRMDEASAVCLEAAS